MGIHLQKDFQVLKNRVLRICTMVEENFDRSINALSNDDAKIQTEIEECEVRIDNLEVEIEEECLKILALHQPVAKDLRFVVSILKINNDLERMGDMTVHIVERLEFVDRELAKGKITELLECGNKVRQMVRKSLDALINLDEKLSLEVKAMDDEVDDFNDAFYLQMKDHIQNEPEHLDTWLNLMFISKQFERIGDHATNIVGDVLYMLKGEIGRHSTD